jgi:tRNA-Thr(GGU) m(6)t(6)A37 methyltransferase TsaA
MAEVMCRSIGAVRRSDSGRVWLAVEEAYRPGLRCLDLFSHAIVVWWVDRHDNEQSRKILQTELPYAPGVSAGVFACRAEYRPNPVALTVAEITAVDESAGTVDLGDIDAFDGSPLLDIKPYIGVVDRVAKIRVPDWYDGWPEWLPEAGIGLYED